MRTPAPLFDAVVLAGGRSSRLGGVPKAGLVLDGSTLLTRTCTALAGAASLTVVGPEPDDDGAWRQLVPEPRFVREEPAFAGPAAALVAGFTAHEGARAPWCAVVACDMPRVGELLAALLDAASAGSAASPGSTASLVAVDGGREQPLAALYRTEDLAAAIGAVLVPGAADNRSVRSLLASVKTREVPVPPGTTHDVDTWADARALGVDVP